VGNIFRKRQTHCEKHIPERENTLGCGKHLPGKKNILLKHPPERERPRYKATKNGKNSEH
jgi:hypothetical protein